MAKDMSKKSHRRSQDPGDFSILTQAATRYSASNTTVRGDKVIDRSNKPEESRYQIDLEQSVQDICDLTLDNRLYVAPLKAPKQVLDIAAGCGIWATKLAVKFPASKVTACDLLPPPPGKYPSNLEFSHPYDCCQRWPYPEGHFDLIHIRGMSGSIPDWPSVYRRALKHLRPGGYVEHLEWSLHIRSLDGKLSSNSIFSRWSHKVIDAGLMLGKTYEIAENMAGLIQEAGFVDVVEKGFKWPIGSWSDDPKMREIGRRTLVNWQRAVEMWTRSLSSEDSVVSHRKKMHHVTSADVPIET